MKKYYRRRIIASAMVAFVILIGGIIGGIFLINCLHTEQNTDRILQNLLLQPEGEKRGRRENAFPPFLGYTSGQRAISTVFCEMELSPEGQLRSLRQHGFSGEESEILSLAEQILAGGKEKGKLGSCKYAVLKAEDGGIRLVLMDMSVQLQMLYGVLVSALVIGLVLSVLLFMILLPVSSRAADMILRGTEKQKRFITDAGHELKTPVAVIRSNLDVMELLNGKNKWSGNIRAQVERLEGLIRQLLLLARLDEKQWTGKTEKIDLSRMVRDEWDTYLEEAERKGQCVETQITEGIRVNGDHDALCQMLHALMDNAVQYTPDGGNIQLVLKREKRQACLTLKNTVEALPEIAPEELTGRFTRGDTARSRKTGGTGIGLSAAGSVAEMCRGTITVSFPGEKEFMAEVRLPAANGD